MNSVAFFESRAAKDLRRSAPDRYLARGQLRSVEPGPESIEDSPPDVVRRTTVPGVVLWGFCRGGRRFLWLPVHETSGAPLTVGLGGVAAAPNLQKARAMVVQLGAARWRGRPVDWRRSAEWLRDCPAARAAVLHASGFVTFDNTSRRSG